MLDVLIKNGRVVDGSGNPWYHADVAVQDGHIAAVGHSLEVTALNVIDAKGKVVCPGFIDMHTHAEGALLIDPAMEPAIRQGVTTQLIAQDGLSFAPLSSNNRETVRWRLSGVGESDQITWDWESVGQFLARLEDRIGINVAFLVPLGNLYFHVMGWDYRAPTPADLDQMVELASQVMDEGAFGLSSGLSYPPQHCFSSADLVTLCRTIAVRGGIYVTHVRYGLGDGFLDPWREAIEIGEQAGIPVHLSHVSIRTRSSGEAPTLLKLFDDARHRGIDLTIESYPYPAGAGWLTAFMPVSFFDGGPAAALARLQDPDTRREIVRYLNFGSKTFRGGLSWDDVYITGVSLEKHKAYEGKSVGEIVDLTGHDPGSLVCDLLLEEKLKVGHKFIYGLERDVRDIMKYEAHMVGSDSIYYGGNPHPRAYGCYPRYLGRYVRELGVLGLEEAVRKMTSFPAQRLGLNDRGLVKPGMVADLVIFDPEIVADRATWNDPKQFPVGIPWVLVNGRITVQDGLPTGNLAGQVLRHTAGLA